MSFLIGQSAWSATSSGITYQGRILKPDGSPLEGANVQFRMQVRTPGAESCLLFEEVQALDMRNTSGSFSLTINDGTGTRTDASGFSIDRVFANRLKYDFDPAVCNSGDEYTPNVADGRRLQVYFRDETMGAWEPMPAQNVNYVPLAIESKQVQGFNARSLLRVQHADGTLGNFSPLSNDEYTELLAVIAGTSTQYGRPNQLNGRPLPTMTAGQVLGWNGTDWVATAAPTGTSTSTTLRDPDASTTFGVTFQASPAINADYTITWPATVGSAGQVLSNTGGGTLGWVTPLTSTTGFVQGGNAFGAIAQLGTTDAQNLQFMTNNAVRATLNQNGYLGLGTDNPNYAVHLVRSDATPMIAIENQNSTAAQYPGFYVRNFKGSGANTGFPKVQLTTSRGTNAAPARTEQDDVLGMIEFYGNHNVSSANRMASIHSIAEANYTSTNAPTALVFSTSRTNTTFANEKMRITGDGAVGIGTSDPLGGTKLDAYSNPTNPNTGLYSITGRVYPVFTAANSNHSYGIYGLSSPNLNSANANSGNHFGVYGSAVMNTAVAGSSINSMIGMRAQAGSNATSNATISNVIALQVQQFHQGGSITNSYGLKIDNPIVGITPTNNFPIYQEGTAGSNVFFANSGFGTASPAEKLHVAGNSQHDLGATGFMRLTTNSGGNDNFIQSAYGNLLLVHNAKSANGSWGLDRAGAASSLQLANNGDIQFNVAPSGAANAAPAWTAPFVLKNSGRLGLSTASPTAQLHIGAGTATANSAPLKLTSSGSGVLLTTPEDGAMEYDGTNLYFTVGSTRRTVSTGASGTLDNVSAINNTSGNIVMTPQTGGRVTVGSNQNSTSPSTGALVIQGGLGVANDVIIGGALTAQSGMNSNGPISAVALSEATSTNNRDSSAIFLSARYWDGAASSADRWSIQNMMGTGANPTSTLTFAHPTGTTGTKTFAFQDGNVRIPDGTPTVPSLQFEGAPTTGFSYTAPSLNVLIGGLTNWSFANGYLTGSGVNGSPRMLRSIGDAATPTYSFKGWTDTGLYAPADDKLSLVTAGTDRLTVDESGRVGIGIGTTTPNTRLQVAGTSGMVPLALTRSDNTTVASAINFWPAGTNSASNVSWSAGLLPNSNDFRFTYTPDAGTTTLSALTLTNGGRVGIGTAGAVTKLDVTGGSIRSVASTGSSATNSSAVIDWSASNNQTLTAACTSTTFSNMADGATYNLAVMDTSATKCVFTQAGLTFYFSPANGTRLAGLPTVYSFTRIGTNVFVSWTVMNPDP